MTEEQKLNVLEMLNKIDNKDFGLYFFTLDTKGNPVASVATIYDIVKALTELGYKAHILHEKNDYHGVGEWLGEGFTELPHVSIEEQELNLNSLDYIIIPEIFSNVMEQVKTFPCKKIILSQSYAYILELLGVGKRWDVDYGFNEVITTSDTQADYVKGLFPSVNTHIIPPSIPEYFKPSDKLKKPIVSILTRDQSTAVKIAKTFYLQNPLYRWVTFRELRGLPKETFAKELGESCLAVWVDDVSGFGTFPLEAMNCDTPVIGKIPDMVPEWMEEVTNKTTGEVNLINNGIWTNDALAIPNLISQYMRAWLEDSVPQEIMDGIAKSKDQYTTEGQKEKVKLVFESLVANRRSEVEALLNTEEKTTE